jgi:hypothetical protein
MVLEELLILVAVVEQEIQVLVLQVAAVAQADFVQL